MSKVIVSVSASASASVSNDPIKNHHRLIMDKLAKLNPGPNLHTDAFAAIRVILDVYLPNHSIHELNSIKSIVKGIE